MASDAARARALARRELRDCRAPARMEMYEGDELVFVEAGGDGAAPAAARGVHTTADRTAARPDELGRLINRLQIWRYSLDLALARSWAHRALLEALLHLERTRFAPPPSVPEAAEALRALRRARQGRLARLRPRKRGPARAGPRWSVKSLCGA
ncbi:hypothetical protein [Phenylobacterium zucineum]|uniref:hypothetical protein n=1 Tax=Phenylobacterium zucineum TaxID=284016 RepID=UPI0011D17242|nr:hypothetical protein [Phenylobacterium zucineum]